VSVGFYLLGRFETAQLQPDDLLRHLENWIERESSDLSPITRLGFVDEKPCLFSLFHPAAEEVEICLTDPDHVTVSANTSTVGPGYHIFLCDLIRRWSDDFSIKWIEFSADDDTTFGDEADYFFSRDKQKVYDQMAHWLRTLTGSFFDGTLDQNSKDIALCMPMNVQFEGNSLAITQLGPRDKDWLFRLSKGLIADHEFFPWHNIGLTAEYYLGRALVHMWSDVRWRRPANDNERRLLRSVVTSLETACRINPDLVFPWNDWNELLDFLEEKGSTFDFVGARVSGPGRIGYRRNRVRTCLPGNWWIETEGSFSEFESDETGALCSFDPPREIWFTAYSFSADNPKENFRRIRNTALGEKHEFTHEDDTYVSVADISKKVKEGMPYYVLQSSCIGLLRRCVCTLVFDKADDREWAIRVWRSLKPSKAK